MEKASGGGTLCAGESLSREHTCMLADLSWASPDSIIV
jgi:hypothetical protein